MRFYTVSFLTQEFCKYSHPKFRIELLFSDNVIIYSQFIAMPHEFKITKFYSVNSSHPQVNDNIDSI
uniref:Uncharacterized protein n=1 Tax=Onchocerca volvulus TaxID=6282 RepID=A0A8R1TK63_ONCVO